MRAFCCHGAAALGSGWRCWRRHSCYYSCYSIHSIHGLISIEWPKNQDVHDFIHRLFPAAQQRWHSCPLWARAYLRQAPGTALYGCLGGGRLPVQRVQHVIRCRDVSRPGAVPRRRTATLQASEWQGTGARMGLKLNFMNFTFSSLAHISIMAVQHFGASALLFGYHDVAWARHVRSWKFELKGNIGHTHEASWSFVGCVCSQQAKS